LESGGELPYLMRIQSPDIYPLYDLTVKARELNILPIIIGSGLGSASAISNYYDPCAIGEMRNPNSQLVRCLFEAGIFGTFFFIRSFLCPVKQLTKHIAEKGRSTFITLTLLLIGCSMGIRSAAPFIYLGIFLAAFCPLLQTKKVTNFKNSL
jgi:O-antigen ligase